LQPTPSRSSWPRSPAECVTRAVRFRSTPPRTS
jgi:hypothetical protein